MLEYLQAIDQEISQASIISPTLQAFSDPNDPLGYNDTSITDDMISDVHIQFSQHSREEESSMYLRTLTGKLS